MIYAQQERQQWWIDMILIVTGVLAIIVMFGSGVWLIGFDRGWW